MSQLCQKTLIKDHSNEQKKSKNRIKCIVLLSIIFPLFIVFITFITQEKELLVRLLKLPRSEISEKVDEVMEVLKVEIQKCKIPLKYRNQHQKVNSKQKINKNLLKKKQTNLLKQTDHLKLIPLKYFTLSQVNIQLDLQNETNSLLIQDESHIDLVKEIEEINFSHSQFNLQRKKHPLQIYDEIIFKVVLMNVNQDQMLIQQQNIRMIENKILKNLKRRSYMGNMIKLPSESYLQDEFKDRPSIDIKFRGGHLSQLDQNYLSKVRSFFSTQKRMLILYENEEETNRQLQEFQYYMEDMINQLEDSNSGSQCLYVRSNTQCKQYLIFVLYQSNQDFNQLFHYTSQVNRRSDLMQERTQYKSLDYWMKEDKSVTLITFHSIKTDSPSHDRKNSTQTTDSQRISSLTLLSTLEELFYEKLNISPLLSLSFAQNKSQKINQALDKTQLFVNQFINLNRMYKFQQIIEQISLILKEENIPYKNIDQTQQNQVVRILETIKNSLIQEDKNQNKTTYQKLLDISDIDSFNEIDPFPSDYKLGALLPIAIILLYPLVGYFKFIFN